MASYLQDGIYFKKGQRPGNSLSIIFLRVTEGCDAPCVIKVLSELWKMYSKLRQGILLDLDSTPAHRFGGNLSVLVGYGPKIFELRGIRKKRPKQLAENCVFCVPNSQGGGPILDQVGLNYAKDVTTNEIANDHILVQFVGETQAETHRAVVQTWKLLRKQGKTTGGLEPIFLRKFYTGYNSPDSRNWLGFHDGVSNIKGPYRSKNIAISNNDLDSIDRWTINGTFLAFLRIAIDLDKWDSIPVKYQERIVGREKASGCPLIGIDKNDRNIRAKGCPVGGTSEITEKGNEYFREHPPYGMQKNIQGIRDDALKKSHIGRMYPIKSFTRQIQEDRIFRQGFDFLEGTKTYPYFRVGVNFISFQLAIDRLFRILRHGLGKVNFGGDENNMLPGMENLLSVRAASIFLVPPLNKQDKFPGESIFNEELAINGQTREFYKRDTSNTTGRS